MPVGGVQPRLTQLIGKGQLVRSVNEYDDIKASLPGLIRQQESIRIDHDQAILLDVLQRLRQEGKDCRCVWEDFRAIEGVELHRPLLLGRSCFISLLRRLGGFPWFGVTRARAFSFRHGASLR